LNLETCDEQELFKVLDGCRARYSIAYYTPNVMAVRMALEFLGRKDVAGNRDPHAGRG